MTTATRDFVITASVTVMVTMTALPIMAAMTMMARTVTTAADDDEAMLTIAGCLDAKQLIFSWLSISNGNETA